MFALYDLQYKVASTKKVYHPMMMFLWW